MELFERHGKPVEEQTFSDRKAALEAVLEKLRLEEFETAAVIEMTQERAKKSAAYLKAVSYTHLDVYKRQVQGFRKWPGGLYGSQIF